VKPKHLYIAAAVFLALFIGGLQSEGKLDRDPATTGEPDMLSPIVGVLWASLLVAAVIWSISRAVKRRRDSASLSPDGAVRARQEAARGDLSKALDTLDQLIGRAWTAKDEAALASAVEAAEAIASERSTKKISDEFRRVAEHARRYIVRLHAQHASGEGALPATGAAESTPADDSSMSILRERLARGEIEVDEFRRLRNALRE
jgi:hypothetical protein